MTYRRNTYPPGPRRAAVVTYDPETSGLAATDVQAAIDEVAATPGGGATVVYPTGDSGTLVFIGNVDPVDDPSTAALVTLGAIWIDTRWGPPYQQWMRVDDGGAYWSHAPWGINYDELGAETYREEPSGWAIGTGALGASLARYAAGQLLLSTRNEQYSAELHLDNDFATLNAANAEGEVQLRLWAVGGNVPTVQIIGLAAADPSVADALWLNNGVLAISGAAPIGTQAADVGAAGTLPEIIAAMRLTGLMAQTAVVLAFDQQPTGALVDATITPAPTVQVLDDLGNLCAFDNETEVTVELTIPGAATLGGTLTRMAVAGVATFDDLSVDVADTYTLTATSGALTEDESASFVISAP